MPTTYHYAWRRRGEGAKLCKPPERGAYIVDTPSGPIIGHPVRDAGEPSRRTSLVSSRMESP
eukprot:scaffold1318_cov106-Isochrysis_galbana.AAC.3